MKALLRRVGAVRLDSTERATPHISVSIASDPAQWQRIFGDHWQRAASIIASRGAVTLDHVDTVFNHLDQMTLALLCEINTSIESSIGPILDTFFIDEILSQVLQWAFATPLRCASACQMRLLKIYETLIMQTHTHQHSLLVHKPILVPLLHLLEWIDPHATENQSTRRSSPNIDSEVEYHFVILLHQICVKIAEGDTLLEFFFAPPSHESGSTQLHRQRCQRENDDEPRFVVFTLLVPYLYDNGHIGQLVRDALLLILTVSRNNNNVSAFIANQSHFAAVLATGLSACFSELPLRLMSADDWVRVTGEDIMSCPPLYDFHSALDFVNAVAQAANELIRCKLIAFIQDGFLTSVVLPSLFESQLEETTTACAYLELVVRCWTEQCLVRVLAYFLISHQDQYENSILDALVSRIGGEPKVCQVALALFNTILSIGCEDILVDLVLRHLMPCTHLLSSQIQRVTDEDSKGKHASKLLSLIPQCVPLTKVLGDISTDQVLNTDFVQYIRSANERVSRMQRLTHYWTFKWDARDPDAREFAPDDSDDESSRFTRAASSRESSRSLMYNSYFASRHTSTASQYLFEKPALDLTVLGGDFIPTDDDYDDIDRVLMTAQDSDTTSLLSTPKVIRRPMTNGYFKLAYDAEIAESDVGIGSMKSADNFRPVSPTISMTTLESDSNQQTNSYLLKGWSKIQEDEIIFDLLKKVKISHQCSARTAAENSSYIRQKYYDLKDERLIVASVPVSDPSTARSEHVVADDSMDIVDHRQHVINTQQRAVPIECGSALITPQLGPFLSCLMARLASFTDNTLTVNLQLTGLLSTLATYPQPLIRSLFCHPNIVLEHSVHSVSQIIAQLAHEIDLVARDNGQNQFDVLLSRAAKFLLSRERRAMAAALNSKPNAMYNIVDQSASSMPNSARSTSDMRSNPSSGDETDQARFRFYQHQSVTTTGATALKTRNIVFCAIVLREFIQELAAISLVQPTVAS